VEPASNRPVAMKVYSWLFTEADPLVITATFGSLFGSATFASAVELNMQGKGYSIAVRNTDYHQAPP
jgi:hypothetical protein